MIPADVPFTVPVINNDSDADGDNLTICEYTQPINGTLAMVGTQLVYTPNTGFSGNDIFWRSSTGARTYWHRHISI